jgi:aspartate ammonia-lyase
VRRDALNPYIGYAAGARIAKLALESGRTIPDLVVEQKLLSPAQVSALLRPEAFMTAEKGVPATSLREIADDGQAGLVTAPG